MTFWRHSPECIGFSFVLFHHPVWFFCWGVLRQPIWCWSAWPPWGVIINVGDWWHIYNPLSLFQNVHSAHPYFSFILGEILFTGIDQWLCELLGSVQFVGSEVLPNFCPFSLCLDVDSGTFPPLCWRRGRDKGLSMIIHHISYLVPDLCVYIVITVHYTCIRS